MKLTELHVEGYRSLVNVTLPLRNLAVLIGPNGAGKTALLEVFLLLRHGADKQLADRLEALGGLQAILSQTTAGPDKLKISLCAEKENIQEPTTANYSIQIAPRGTGYAFPSERLEWQKGSHQETLFDAQHEQITYFGMPVSSPFPPGHQRLELALAQIPAHLRETLDLQSTLSSIQFYSSFDVSQRAVVRLPQSLTPARHPGPNGENLYSALYNLRLDEPAAYSRIVELLQIGFPGFQRFEFPVVGAGQVILAWYQQSIATPLYPNQLSEGTLRFPWLAAILFSPATPAIILMDEPEVSLHPELLKLLAGMLQDAAQRCQVVVATHSPDLIRWLEPGEVLVTEKVETGATAFTWADSLNLQAWLEEYTLRDLWLMGTLRGRP